MSSHDPAVEIWEEISVERVSKGKGDRRYVSGNVGARTEPRFPHGDVSLWKFVGGQRFTLYLSFDEAYALSEALNALLDELDDEREKAGR